MMNKKLALRVHAKKPFSSLVRLTQAKKENGYRESFLISWKDYQQIFDCKGKKTLSEVFALCEVRRPPLSVPFKVIEKHIGGPVTRAIEQKTNAYSIIVSYLGSFVHCCGDGQDEIEELSGLRDHDMIALEVKSSRQ